MEKFRQKRYLPLRAASVLLTEVNGVRSLLLGTSSKPAIPQPVKKEKFVCFWLDVPESTPPLEDIKVYFNASHAKKVSSKDGNSFCILGFSDKSSLELAMEKNGKRAFGSDLKLVINHGKKKENKKRKEKML